MVLIGWGGGKIGLLQGIAYIDSELGRQNGNMVLIGWDGG